MEITPHTGLIYFNQKWPEPDKRLIPPLRSSIPVSSAPSLPPSRGFGLISLVTHRTSSSQAAIRRTASSPWNHQGQCRILIHDKPSGELSPWTYIHFSARSSGNSPCCPFPWHFPWNEKTLTSWWWWILLKRSRKVIYSPRRTPCLCVR